MKIDWNKKYTTIAFYAFITAAAVIVFGAVVFNIAFFAGVLNRFLAIISPFIIGFCIAYLLLPIVKMFNNLLKNIKFLKNKLVFNNAFSVILSFILLLFLLFIFVYVVIPGLYSSLLTFLQNIEYYAETAMNWARETFSNQPAMLSLLDKITDYFKDISEDVINQVLPFVTGVASGVFVGIKNFLVGLIAAVYFLLRRKQFCAQVKKTVYAVFSKKVSDGLVNLVKVSDKAFSGFISGKFITSIIMGVLTYVFMSVLGIPYALLISVLIAVTDIIPFFGPFIGAVPSVIIILLINPWKALWLAIYIIVLQQLEGNIISPRILGKTVGIPAIWVMFAIIVGGGLFGVVGMIVGVPLFSVIYSITKDFIEIRLRNKKLSPKTEDYYKKEA
jgi:predicted PurR-regulated permease PerM